MFIIRQCEKSLNAMGGHIITFPHFQANRNDILQIILQLHIAWVLF